MVCEDSGSLRRVKILVEEFFGSTGTSSLPMAEGGVLGRVLRRSVTAPASLLSARAT